MLEFIRTVKDLRKAQRRFDRNKSKDNMKRVKELTLKVDAQLKNFKIEQLNIFEK